MKSIGIVLGSFLFFLFSSGFSRLVISLYHSQDFSVTGYAQYPSEYWTVILLISDTLFIWVSGMLTITITGFAPVRHLMALGVILIVWRVNDIIYSSGAEPVWISAALILSVISGLGACYLVHRSMKMNSVNGT